MTRPPEIKKRTSSGGVIFRPLGSEQENPHSGIEVVIVSVRGRKAWCLPKGIIDRGEDAETAALREVREETGLWGEIIENIGSISYWYFLRDEMIRMHKTVHFFLLRYLGGNTDDHDNEVDEAKWFPIDDAIKQLTHKSEKDIMQKAKVIIERIMGPRSQ